MRTPLHQLVVITKIILERRGLLCAAVLIVALSLSVIGLAVADDALAPIKMKTDIPAQPLGAALQELARDRNFQIVYVSEEVNSLRTQGAVGDLTVSETLQQLLAGTGLTFRYLDEKTVMIVPESAAPRQPKEGQLGPRK
jgi:iron complex outermembrane receptor protein